MIGEIVTGLFCKFGELGRRRRSRFNDTAQTDPLMSAHLVANLAGPDAQPPELFTAEHVAYALGA